MRTQAESANTLTEGPPGGNVSDAVLPIMTPLDGALGAVCAEWRSH